MRLAVFENGKYTYRDATENEILEMANSDEAQYTEATELDRIEAQLMYTALMTDTLLEEMEE